MVDCDSGTSAAPKTPCNSRNITICGRDCAAPHSMEAAVKPNRHSRKRFFRPNRMRQPAHRRRHDRRGHHIGCQHPGDLIGRRRQRALHVGQGHIGDGGIQRLHQRRDHQAHGDQRAMRNHHFRAWGLKSAMAGLRNQVGKMPGMAGVDVHQQRSCQSAAPGRRAGGRYARAAECAAPPSPSCPTNSAPAAPRIPIRWPVRWSPPMPSSYGRDRCPPTAPRGRRASHRSGRFPSDWPPPTHSRSKPGRMPAVAAARYMPGCSVSTWVTMPSNGANTDGMLKLALRLVHLRLRLQILRQLGHVGLSRRRQAWPTAPAPAPSGSPAPPGRRPA